MTVSRHLYWSKEERAIIVRMWATALPAEICAALPKRTISSIRQMAVHLGLRKVVSRKKWPRIRFDADSAKHSEWTIEEADRLALLWPEATTSELSKAFPKRTFRALRDRASALGLRRIVGPRAQHATSHPIFRELAIIRRRRGLPAKIVAFHVGVHPSTLCYWEQGHSSPKWERLIRWLEALDCSLSLNDLRHISRIGAKTTEAASLPIQPLRPLTKAELMRGKA